MTTREALANWAGRFQALLSRTVATLPIAYADAQTRTRKTYLGAMESVAAVCGSRCNFRWFLPGASTPHTPLVALAIPSTLCFRCPNNSHEGFVA